MAITNHTVLPTATGITIANSGTRHRFGERVATSKDGTVFVVSCGGEDSDIVNPFPNTNLTDSGAAYVYKDLVGDGSFTEVAVLKASNAGSSDFFGTEPTRGQIDINADGSVIVIPAPNEDSSFGGGPSDNSTSQAGAVYVFEEPGGGWESIGAGTIQLETAFLKPSVTSSSLYFGSSVSIDDAGDTIVVGHQRFPETAWVYNRPGGGWSTAASPQPEDATLLATVTDVNDYFGRSVRISGNGNVIVVGAEREDSNSASLDPNDNSDSDTGELYVFVKGESWTGAFNETQMLKTPPTWHNSSFITQRHALCINLDGSVICAGDPNNGSDPLFGPTDSSLSQNGGIHVFEEPGGGWGSGPVFEYSTLLLKAHVILDRNGNEKTNYLGAASIRISDDGTKIFSACAGGADMSEEMNIERWDRPGSNWTTGSDILQAATIYRAGNFQYPWSVSSNFAQYDLTRFGGQYSSGDNGNFDITETGIMIVSGMGTNDEAIPRFQQAGYNLLFETDPLEGIVDIGTGNTVESNTD